MQGARVRSLVRELRSRMLHGVAKKKKRKKIKGEGKRWEKVKKKKEFVIIKVGKNKRNIIKI